MNKFLKLTGVSVLTIVAATGANAAGYTCEELIEYTSCNDGYYLNSGDCIEGATCGAGNYLAHVCPGDDEEFPEYIYSDNWCYDGDMMTSSGWDGEDMTQNLCEEEYGGEYFGPGCVYWEIANIADGGKATGEEFVPVNVECVACDAGTYQPSAGQYSCITCDAGTYQPNAGQASCIDAPVGNYVAKTGATAYTACPASDLTDANGNVVSVTTESTGATSSSACFVAKGTEFKDDKGIYRYTDNCDYGNYPALFESSEEDSCPDGWSGAWDGDLNNYFCYKVPTTPSECAAISNASDWYDRYDEGTEGCYCRDDSESFYVGNDGKLICI
ncbi:MAG: hypothetical protein IKB10_04330 [Alphaproteobacteria bacterium]|nr:hypothetical protein [Alphaproteobacteria bacterium]